MVSSSQWIALSLSRSVFQIGGVVYTGAAPNCNLTTQIMDIALNNGGFIRFSFTNTSSSASIFLNLYPSGSCISSPGAPAYEQFYSVSGCAVANSVCGVASNAACAVEPTYQCVSMAPATDCSQYSTSQCGLVQGCALTNACTGPGACSSYPDQSYCQLDYTCLWQPFTCVDDCSTKDLAVCGGHCTWSPQNLCVSSNCSALAGCGTTESQGCEPDFAGICQPASYRYNASVVCPFKEESYCSDYYYCDPSLVIYSASTCQSMIDAYCCSAGFQSFDTLCLSATSPGLNCSLECKISLHLSLEYLAFLAWPNISP